MAAREGTIQLCTFCAMCDLRRGMFLGGVMKFALRRYVCFPCQHCFPAGGALRLGLSVPEEDR